MATTVLGVVCVLLVPVGIAWRITLHQMKDDPAPQVKLFFWVMSGLFVALAGTAFVATRYLE